MKRLAVISILLILVGLLLLLPSNPLLGILTGGLGSTSSNQAAAFVANSGTNSDPTTTIESMVGFGLVGVGLLLEVFSLFTDVVTPGPRPEIAEVERK